MSQYLTGMHNRVVAAYFNGDTPETPPNFIGILVAHYDHPTALIDTGDGLHPHAWSGTLVRLATRDEELEFWRQRALKAEAATKVLS